MPALKQTMLEMEKHMMSSGRSTYCFERIRNTLAFSSKTETATKDRQSDISLIIMTNHQLSTGMNTPLNAKINHVIIDTTQ